MICAMSTYYCTHLWPGGRIYSLSSFSEVSKHVCEAGFHLRNSIGEAEVPGISSIQSSAERLSHFMYFTDLFLFIWEDDVGVKCLHHQQSLAQGPRTLPENLKTCA